jgi:4-amino-4-deoxy-L-arabinose transferase-like glycosyltransferase
MDTNRKLPESAWWRCGEFWALLTAVAFVYTWNLDGLTVRGEESRRGQIALEMIWSGNWILPQIQSQPVYFRPPLQNAAIAVTSLMTGSMDA